MEMYSILELKNLNRSDLFKHVYKDFRFGKGKTSLTRIISEIFYTHSYQGRNHVHQN